jgi:lactose/L-arabinose transport system ATP-binding protein
MASLELTNLEKTFGTTQVLKRLDLAVADGEFVVFVGPSGCGKSTLLRLIAGLEGVSGGEVVIGGRTVTHLPPAARGVAMVFQSYALYPHMSVEENIGFGLRIAGVAKAVRREKVALAAQVLQLTPYLKRKPKELSGGQRQRVAIGRAIVKEPGIFLFDEPLSNLDAELRTQMRIEIGRLHRELRATMIYVTHDQVEAMTLADRIVVLRDGQIEQVGKPMELYANPANSFVAGFIGSPKMNFVAVQVQESHDDSVWVRAATLGAEAILVRGVRSPVAPGMRATLGFRPEHILIDPAGIASKVEFVEQLGHVAYAFVRAQNGARIIMEQRGTGAAASGAPLQILPDPDSCFLFSESGARL